MNKAFKIKEFLKRSITIFLIVVLIYTSFSFANPVFFEIYAEAVYDRDVTFKNINADISILSTYTEFEDSGMEENSKTLRDFSRKLATNQNPESIKKIQELNVLDEVTMKDLDDYKFKGDKEALKKVSKKYKVKIDRNKFKSTHVAKKSVDTYAEMLEFQNEMMDNPSEMYKLTPDPKKYPNLVRFLNEANKTAENDKGYKMSLNDTSQLKNNLATNANIDLWLLDHWWAPIANPNVSPEEARSQCGYYGNDKPNINLTWQRFKVQGEYDNKEKAKRILNNWGYHETASYAKLNTYSYTRDQTFNSYYCGNNTFRDDAMFQIYTTADITTCGWGWWSYKCGKPWAPYEIREQNYNGNNPRGEPNPEVIGKSWPYSNWGTYVYWWHQYHNAGLSSNVINL